MNRILFSCRYFAKFNKRYKSLCTRAMDNIADLKKDRIVWVDLEMTGLDVDTERIIEMACLVTDADLNIIAEGPNLIIKQPDELLNNMSEWCVKHHGESGLTQSVRDSSISESEAERQMLDFVRQHTVPGHSPLGGNSIGQDRNFLSKYMKNFTSHLHYRVIDVSTVKELTRRWNPKAFNGAPQKKFAHRAMDDIKDSVAELKYYRHAVFK